MERFEELKVWQKGHQLVLLVYKISSQFPDSEKYGLVSQMRRAAVSVVANIVEGAKRRTSADRLHFHTMADGSLEELKYYFILCRDLKSIQTSDYQNLASLASEVGAMLGGLSKSIKNQSRS